MPEPVRQKSDALTPDDVLADLALILAHSYGELRVVVQDGVILSCSPTIHRRRRAASAR